MTENWAYEHYMEMRGDVWSPQHRHFMTTAAIKTIINNVMFYIYKLDEIC